MHDQSKSTHEGRDGDEDGIRQVTDKGDASSSRLPVWWECERLEGVKNWRKPDMHVSSLGLKTRARPVRLDDGYEVHVASSRSLHGREAREGSMPIRLSVKKVKEYLGCALHVSVI